MAKRNFLTEDYVAQCAHGGKLVPKGTSSTPGVVCAGVPIVNIQDLPGTPIKGCPKKSPCTKVANFSSACAEMNNKSAGVNLALDLIGVKSNKGAAITLSFNGQTVAGAQSYPDLENVVINEEEPQELELIKAKNLIKKEKYALYFLRKSEEEYKPLRPTRAFRKEDEGFLSKNDILDIKDNIYVHTYAYIYIKQNTDIKEYKVLSKGCIYNEKVSEIYFENTKTKIKYNYIPIYEDDNIDISYSSIALKDENDIKKLKRLSLNPKKLDENKSFYFKDIKGIDKQNLTKEDLQIQKKFEVKKEKKLNILCILEDILGEIEDMYERYYTNFKLAYAHNHSLIEDIKKQNQYTYTITNIIDYFHLSNKEKTHYKQAILELKKIYNQLVKLLLTDFDLVQYLAKYKDISKIIDKDKNKVAQSYFHQIQFLKKDFFIKEFKNEEKEESLKQAFYSKTNFRTNNKFPKKYIYLTSYVKQVNKRYISNMHKQGIQAFEFNSSNDDYTKIKDNASYVLAHVLFSLFYSQEFEEDLKQMQVYSKINSLRNSFLLKLRALAPKPNIDEKSIEDIQEIVKNQEIYNDIINKEENLKDKFLEEYENLDYIKKLKSFEQKTDKIKFKSKYIYYEDESYYKSHLEKPKDIIKKIEKKLQDEKLKELLKIYENIKVENKLSYVVSCMNIVYLLSAPRVNLDEETNKNSFFNEKLNHIYEFVEHLTKEKIALNDQEKESLRFEYKISEAYSLMQMRLILNDILFSNSKKKALKFIEKFKVAVKSNTKTDINYKYIHNQSQNIKSKEKQYYEALKNIEGISSNIDKILDEIQGKEVRQYSISQKTVVYLSSGLKTYSTLIAMASATNYLFLEDNKNIKSHIGFVKDLTDISLNLGLAISKYPNKPLQVLEYFLKTDTVKEISLASKRVLSYIQRNIASKVAIISILITAAYEIINLYSKEDYNALALTTLLSGVSIALFLSQAFLPAVVLTAVMSIIAGLILDEIIDSDVDLYLKKSLLYKNINFSIWKNIKNEEQDKKYQAPYLFEITNKNKELKTIADDGFNNIKKLIEFIGKNYKTNEDYFDTALRNELSFFKAALFGYKLQITKFQSQQKVRTVRGIETNFYVQKALKIPKVLVEDKEFKLYFSPYKDEYLEFSLAHLIQEQDYYIFNFFPKENPYFFLNHFTNTIKRENISSYIVIINSQAQLKYEVEFRDNDKTGSNFYIDIAFLKQISFNTEDKQLIKE